MAYSANAAKGVFSTNETFHANLKPFPKWEGVLEKYFSKASLADTCLQADDQKCGLSEWSKMLRQAQKLPPMKQLVAVNKFMNGFKYVVDPINWGVKDYWAIPQEFMSKFGDCEDYSIAKYMSLRALGWKGGDMRVVVLQDLNLKAMHAVLAVKHDGRNLILDNQVSLVVSDDKIHHYNPVFSVNEKGWWRHRKPSSSRAVKMLRRPPSKVKRIIPVRNKMNR